jgi:hypothetical protein
MTNETCENEDMVFSALLSCLGGLEKKINSEENSTTITNNVQ